MAGEERELPNPEAELLRSQVLEALKAYEIAPVVPFDIQRLRYAPDYFEFLHNCHDLRGRLIRVVDDQVYVEDVDAEPGFHRIDHLKELEAMSARFTALFYDPRWLISRLKDLEIAQEAGGRFLKGNIYPAEVGFVMKQPLDQLEGQSKEQLLKAEVKKPWEFLIAIDERFLPSSVITTEPSLLFMLISEENSLKEITFRYFFKALN